MTVVTGLERPLPSAQEAIEAIYDPTRGYMGDLGRLALSLSTDRPREETDFRLVRGLGYEALKRVGRAEKISGARLPLAGRNAALAELWSIAPQLSTDEKALETVINSLGMEERAVGLVTRSVERHTDSVVEQFVGLIKDIKKTPDLQAEYTAALGVTVTEDITDMALAALLLPYFFHDGDKRKNGNRDYFTHVRRAMMLYQLGLTNTENVTGEKLSDKHRDRQLFIIGAHDIIEKSTNKDGNGSVYDDIDGHPAFRAPPLFINKLLVKLGETPEGSLDMLDSILRLSKTHSIVDGKGLDHEYYEQRYLGKIATLLGKLADTLDNNKIDPLVPDETNIVRAKALKAKYDLATDVMIDRIISMLGDTFGQATATCMREIAHQFKGDPDGFRISARGVPFGLRTESAQSPSTNSGALDGGFSRAA